MAITKEERLRKVHYDALKDFDNIQSAVRDERLQCLQDRRFYSIAGAQWEGPLGEQFANKPRFEVNKIHLSVIRIFNEYRNNRIDVDFISKDGSENDKLADVCNGLYRADEQDSNAEEAYDNGFEEAVGGGIGAWRLRTKYQDEDNDDDERQRICIEPIFDADSSVFFDLNAKRQDKSDATKCYVLSSMTLQSYIDEYDDDPATWPKEIHQWEFDWQTPDVVFVAEYYVVEHKRETIFIYETLDGEQEEYTQADFEDDLDLRERLEAVGSREVEQKKRKIKRIHKYLMSGSKVLEDCGYISGKCIPVVPVYGKRWFVDNVERCMGQVRLAKDAQRLKNMQLSRLGEIAALSPVEKPIFTPEQMAGNQVMWSEDNIKNYPYLLVNAMKGLDGSVLPSGPIAYTKAPSIPQAMAALLQVTETDINYLLGNQQGGEEIVSNISGKAVELIQNRLDMQSFIYMSNMAKAIKRTGEIWLSMAKDVMVESGRKMKSIGPQGQVTSVELMQPKIGDNGETVIENDLSNASFDVVTTVGPSSDSKRAKVVRELTGMMAIADDPETRQVLTAMAMMNMEGEGLSDVNDYFRGKLIRMGAVKPTDEELQQLQAEQQNAIPDPNSEYLRAAAKEAEAGARERNAGTLLKVKQAEKAQAETMEVYAGIDQAEKAQALDAVQTFANLSVETARASADTARANGETAAP